MCKHVFVFPEDKPENYNPDGKTITGRCKCGATRNGYGVLYVMQLEEKNLRYNPYISATCMGLDKHNVMW